ncbi:MULTISPECIES: MbnP family protein [Flavobacteriaceae]|uniref:MbnP family protein n=1 Tax=Flavobacteriaceae TaxID=49546 RepID=UPI001490BFF5|nr:MULTISPECIES: MbnP family protein [Allomuricauda]MDC6364433.1 hypothetical protein [Muricauda sp. AC10]
MKAFDYTAIVLLCTLILSCTNDDNSPEELTGVGSINIEFDNAYGDSDLLLETTSYVASGTENLKIATLKYIVSNIQLEDEKGNTFTYPKDDSMFIVDESEKTSQFINLKNVPAANYTKITFGLGVDQEKYLQGADGQGDFLTLATDAGMMWSWQAGYKFIRYEGTFTSENITDETAFAIHMGSHGSVLDNYKEISLDLPVSAKVRTDMEPEIHVVADVSDILVATNTLSLEEKSQIHVDAEKSPKIAENASQMFTVDHVHN